MNHADPNARVLRVVFKEIVGGDRKKFSATSNESKTGGGARDLRFRPSSIFEPAFEKLCPRTKMEPRRRNSTKSDTVVRVGTIAWFDQNGDVASDTFAVESPTDSRQGELRIAKVHQYPAFRRYLEPEPARTVLLLIQRQDGSVWPEFRTESDLRLPGWPPKLSGPILARLDATTKISSKGYRTRIAKGCVELDGEQ